MRDLNITKLFGIIILSFFCLMSASYLLLLWHFDDPSNSLVDKERMVIAVPKIRLDIDKLMEVTPLKAANQSLDIHDPILDANRFIKTALQNELDSHDEFSLSPNLFPPGNEWLRVPMLAAALSKNFPLFEHSYNFSYWTLDIFPKAPGSDSNFDIRSLNTLIKLRLRMGDYLPYKQQQVIRDVYQLALLALSSQHMTLMIEALQWLDTLRSFYENRFNLNSPFDIEKNEENLSHFTKTLWASAAFIDWTIDDALFAALFSHIQNDHLILCTALNERLPSLTMERQFLLVTHPIEFKMFESRVDKIKTYCRPSRALSQWEQALHSTPPKIGIVGQISKLVLSKINRPDFLNAY